MSQKARSVLLALTFGLLAFSVYLWTLYRFVQQGG